MILAAAAALIWSLRNGEVTPRDGADMARRVGSLQKAWVLRAWAEPHPGEEVPPPVIACGPASRCWLSPGHGAVSLRRATAVSCNTYFRALARGLPERALHDALTAAGFEVDGTLDESTAIGLDGGARVTITPARLLRAYAALVTTPWSARDDLRRVWLDGMCDAAEDGTAARLGHLGLLAKTGTVRSAPGAGAATSGWAVAVDPAGDSAWLAYLPRGTGRDAIAALGRDLDERLLTGARARRAPDTVRVRLFEALRGAEVRATNAGDAPVSREGSGEARWVGPGARVRLGSGESLGSGLWRLEVPRFGLERVVRGALEGGRSPVLVTTPRDYAEGVIRGELAGASPARAEELAAAVLRFLARGRRHGSEDVCDLTHCARFVGLGPEVAWESPTRARLLAPPLPVPPSDLDDASWERVRDAARVPGPSTWSGHCGGDPLSEHAVWGRGSREAAVCPRHPRGSGAVWTRHLPSAELESAFGAPVSSLEAYDSDGVLRTRVLLGGGRELRLLYDELHTRLAARLGWDSLPSPPDRFTRTADGFTAEGRGAGHRVGVCLSD